MADTVACPIYIVLASQLIMGANTEYTDTNPKRNAPFLGLNHPIAIYRGLCIEAIFK